MFLCKLSDVFVVEFSGGFSSGFSDGFGWFLVAFLVLNFVVFFRFLGLLC